MCKLISIKSAVPKSAVDGTKSAVEGRKKSHTPKEQDQFFHYIQMLS
jgi:hypothetical protein